MVSGTRSLHVSVCEDVVVGGAAALEELRTYTLTKGEFSPPFSLQKFEI